MKRNVFTLTVLAGLVVGARPASAIPVLDFGSAGAHGSISDGDGLSGAALARSGLIEHTLTGNETPLKAGASSTLGITGGLLNFKAGTDTYSTYGWDAGTPCAALHDAGCSITISRAVPSPGANDVNTTAPFASQLLSTTIVQPGSAVLGFFNNFVNAIVASSLGVPATDTKPSSSAGPLALSVDSLIDTTPSSSADPLTLSLDSLTVAGSTASVCSSASPCVLGSDTQVVPTSTPEPGSLTLLGFGLLIGAGRLRRHRVRMRPVRS